MRRRSPDGTGSVSPEPLPENARLLAYLQAQAVPSRRRSPFEIDDYELHCHPELVERLAEIGAGVVDLAPAFGLPVLVHPDGVTFAFAQGTSVIALRVRVELQREVLEAPGSGRRTVPSSRL